MYYVSEMLPQGFFLYVFVSILPALSSYVPARASTLRMPAVLISRISVNLIYVLWSLSLIKLTVDFQQVSARDWGEDQQPRHCRRGSWAPLHGWQYYLDVKYKASPTLT